MQFSSISGYFYDFTNEIFSYYNNTYTITFDRLLDTQDAFDFIITKVILI